MNDHYENKKNEFSRVLELSEFDLDYTDLNDHLKDLTRLAANVAGSEISLVNLIDSYTQWTVSRHGIEIQSMPREDSACQFTILNDEPFEIKDLTTDSRLKDKFYVKDDPHLKYYFGIPLKTDQGSNIGALCVLDRQEKELTPEKIELLKIVADEIVTRLESAKKMSNLQEKIKELSQTQRNLSHDIRGPVSGIIGLSELIKEHGSDSNGDLKDIMKLSDLIYESGLSVLELADEILDANREELKNKKPELNELDLLTFKEKLNQLYAPQAVSKQIDLKINCDEENSQIPFSKHRLLQITGNLISNAIKFTPKEGKVTVNLSLTKLKDRNRLKIEVSDTGIGIDEEQLKFIKSGKSESTKGTSGERGFGFGLSLVKHLVDSSQGTIEVTSELGKGSTFRVELPR